MIEERIKLIPLFASLPESEIHFLVETLEQRHYEAGTLLVQENHPAARFFIVLDGEVEIIKAIATSDQRRLAIRKAGTFIGEMGLLSEEGLHTATVRARTPILLLEMTRDDFDALLHRQPMLAYDMVRTLTRRLNESENLTIRDLRRKNRELRKAYKELEEAHLQIVEKERLERELEVARDIQSSILPQTLPEPEGYEFGALMSPMSAIGGDFYDFIDIGKGKIAIAVGDVSDHGVPAALFMAMTVTMIRAEARRAESPADVLRCVNRQLLKTNEMGMFVTILYGVLDCESRQLNYVRAGHEPPLVINSGREDVLLPRKDGMLLGVFDEPAIDEQQVTLEPGGTLVMYTDGIYEAINPLEVMFGLERVREVARMESKAPAQALCQLLYDEVLSYQDPLPQQDDITIVAVQVQ
ncbi:MAG TPA: SpoIIE family protein phosphatase [Anaerolineales bacterium]|nr:SpoIIE family protein phosphatase [Anaerolineales bacterium]